MRLVIAPFPLVYGSDIQANSPNQVPLRPLGLEPESAGANSPRCVQNGCAILSCTHACAGGVGSNSSKAVGTPAPRPPFALNRVLTAARPRWRQLFSTIVNCDW